METALPVHSIHVILRRIKADAPQIPNLIYKMCPEIPFRFISRAFRGRELFTKHQTRMVHVVATYRYNPILVEHTEAQATKFTPKPM